MAVSIVLFGNFKTALLDNFDDHLRNGAYNIAQKTSVNPKVVPLPQGNESFIIIYKNSVSADTFFRPAVSFFKYPTGKDSFATARQWRTIKIFQQEEDGGKLELVYALPYTSIEKSIRQLSLLIFAVLFTGLVFAVILAYWLAGHLLTPVKQVMLLANSANLNENTELLNEPEQNDELKELIVSFNRMLLRIRDQSARQTAFFASASHELRTPLSIMQTSLQVLLHNEPAGSHLKEMIDTQLREVKRLAKMTNDFLLLSELNNGNMQVVKTRFSLTGLLNAAIEKYHTRVLNKGLKIKVSFSPVDSGFWFFSDENKLQIILDNLLENAVKYAKEESTLELNLSGDDSKYVFSVINSIRPDIHPQIADVKNEFYHSKPLHGEGSGLGLWIAHQLAGMLELELYVAIKEKKFFEAVVVMYVVNSE